MNRQEFCAAFRMARLVRRFERDMRIGLVLPYQMDARAFMATIRYDDVLCIGYAGTGHRCGRRKPRRVAGPRGVLPA